MLTPIAILVPVGKLFEDCGCCDWLGSLSGLGALLVCVELGSWLDIDDVALDVIVEDEEVDAIWSSFGSMVKRWLQVTKLFLLSSHRSK